MFLSVAASFLFAAGASAQSFTSTAELKFACENNPNNVVNINVPAQISSGPQAPATESVNTKCTLVLGSQVTFEASQVSMTFAGPLRIQGGTESHVLFVESEFTATAISSTTTSKSLFQVERSLLRSTSGNIAINTGTEGSLNINGPLVGGNLVSAGAVNLSGGVKFAADLNDALISASTGINVNLTGSEGRFTSTTSTLEAQNGAVNITGSGDKNYAEFKFNSVVASPRGVNVRLNGNESEIVANQFNLDGGLGIILRTGGSKGKVTADDGVFTANAAISIQSSTAGNDGVALLKNATANAGGAIRVETGAKGSTEVLDSSLTSPSLIRFATGAAGNCKSQNNVLTAPTLQVCQ